MSGSLPRPSNASAAIARPLDTDSLVAGDRLRGTPLVLLLDVDGTLAPIVDRPADARVPDDARAALAALVAMPGVHVALVSGRGVEDARRVAGVEGVWVAGNHGAEVAEPGGMPVVHPALLPHERALARAVAALAPLVAELPGATLEDKRWTLSAHYRQVKDPDAVQRLRAAVDSVAAREGLRVHQGKMVLELRAPADVHKGVAVLQIARALGATIPTASVLYAGDDTTDEDAFRALRTELPHAVTIRVGGAAEQTAAELVTPAPRDVHLLLHALRSARASMRGAAAAASAPSRTAAT